MLPRNKYKLLLLILVSVFSVSAFAPDPTNLGEIAGNLTESFSNIGRLIMATAYVAGISLTMASIFKFKQHKDNPTQIPMGTPIALMLVGISLIFLPSFVKPAGTSLFGSGASEGAGGFKGSGVKGIPGGKEGT